ncbi:cysteine--tRNA ligase [Candidatus Microgenomates bacterium]|nr:MAG: cysteine--tRNA ligase [Candidatus Microgenomates bacterium]
MKIYNSLSREIEKFEPINSPKVGMYTCGPTVYFYPHVGNWRTFVLGDVVVRSLKYFGYEVDYVMNITDVGHLTGDNLGDASSGEDRLEKGARREGKTAWDVAEYYTKDFLKGYEKLNMTAPKVFCKATEHITEQIEMIRHIEEKGFVYRISDGVYFDVGAYVDAGNEYGLMSNLHLDDTESRIAENKEKKDSRDFALWKFSGSEDRQMEWDSPWGKGYPGWHIECTAMSCKYLGEQFDIHIGGEDHKSTHHPNEIAQAEAATGKKPFVRYWVHGAFLTVDGGRMGKSLGNAYTLQDIESRKIDVLALRYFYLTGHYRKQLNFTWEVISAASASLKKLKGAVEEYETLKDDRRTELSEEKLHKVDLFRAEFGAALENDLNTPQALAVVWKTIKSNIPNPDKLDLLYSFDEVLGFGLRRVQKQVIPVHIEKMVATRAALRSAGKYSEADQLRQQIEETGYEVVDNLQKTEIKKR